MKITRKQLRKIIREAAKSTKKYDDNPALKGKQSELPDELQKGIIKKNDGDLDEMDALPQMLPPDPEPAPAVEMHRCMDGSMVPADSGACYEDILNRIDDAQYSRDHHTCGTENRVYYNGMLKGLRNKRNRLKKKLEL